MTVNIDDSTAGITKMKTVKVPLTKYYEFYGYTPAAKTYLYKWKGEESLPNSPAIFAVEARQGKIQACALDDIDDLREDILKKAGNLTLVNVGIKVTLANVGIKVQLVSGFKVILDYVAK